MAEFLEAQLDFIFFFYGLAFILLGAVCFAIVRGGHSRAWAVLGCFGLAHGATEWLDLAALVAGDSPPLAATRFAVMAASFVLLCEFPRQSLKELGWKVPGRWIFAPLLLGIALAGVTGGIATASVVARYTLALGGAAATSLVFAVRARTMSGLSRRYANCAAVVFALYAVAAGAIVHTAPFWPADVVNQEAFARWTGIPIQLIRGCLACASAFLVWRILGQKRQQALSSPLYTDYVHKQLVWAMSALTMIFLGGWGLTEYLGQVYKHDIEHRSQGDVVLVTSRFEGETAIADGAARVLAGAVSGRSSFADGPSRREAALLALAREASGAARAYIVDRSGAVVASADDPKRARGNRTSYVAAPGHQEFMTGEAGHHFAFDAESNQPVYLASFPIRSAAGGVMGAAVLEISLGAAGADLRRYDQPYFLIDPHGLVVLTNQPEMMLRTLWPLTKNTGAEVATLFGPAVSLEPKFAEAATDGSWARVDVRRDYVRRSFLSKTGWSVVLLNRTEEIFASRLLGIAITLLMTILTLVYLLGREHAVFDQVQMDKRLELQELASDLRFQASTDPLTGLNNRLRFNEMLAHEMSRSQRHGTATSLVLFDIDHFKRINDTHGHLAGDKVLVKLSQIVAARLRNEDVLARWGGEEFVLLLPESNATVAAEVAESLRLAIYGTDFDRAGPVSCSFGVAQLAGGDSAKTLIARADAALYRAKANGRNRVETHSLEAGPGSGVTAAA